MLLFWHLSWNSEERPASAVDNSCIARFARLRSTIVAGVCSTALSLSCATAVGSSSVGARALSLLQALGLLYSDALS